MARPVPPAPADDPGAAIPSLADAPRDEAHGGSARLTGAQLSAINRFPDDNPNPVLRMDGDGHLIYANPASAPVRHAMGIEVGDAVPDELVERFGEVALDHGFVELTWADRTF